MKQIQKQVNLRRCAYSKCNQILFNTRKKNQLCCHTEHTQLYRNEVTLKKLREETKAKKEAKQVFKAWLETKEPIYKLALINQMRIKFVILDEDHRPTLKQQRINKHNRNVRFWKKNKTKYSMKNREFYFITHKKNFVRFWDRIEFADN